jgi:hypothetical protein
MGQSDRRSGKYQGQSRQQTVPAKSNQHAQNPNLDTAPKLQPTVVSTEAEFRRTPGAVADMTISSFGVRRNEAKFIKTTLSNGHVSQEIPYDNKSYRAVANLNAQINAIKQEFFKTRWIQLLIQVLNLTFKEQEDMDKDTVLNLEDLGTESMVLESMNSLEDFSDLVTNVVVTIELPFLSNLARIDPHLMKQTPGYMLIEDIIQRIKEFKSLQKLNVVLSLPHTFERGLHELQLAFIRPFYELSFTNWVLLYKVPGMPRSERVSSKDVGVLHRYHLSLLKDEAN